MAFSQVPHVPKDAFTTSFLSFMQRAAVTSTNYETHMTA